MRYSPQKLRRMLTTYAVLFVTLLVILVGLALTMLDTEPGAVVILSALGVNLVASAVFALIFSLVAGRLQDANLEQTVRDEMAQLAAQVTEEISRSNRLFLPGSTYPAITPMAGDFGRPYNTDVTASLVSSSICYFRGTSAWFVGKRLAEAAHRPQSVWVTILDPRDEAALNQRAGDRRAAQPDLKIDQSRRLLVQEILMSVVALFDLRQSGSIEITYDNDSSVYRYEIYDDALYLSWFHGPKSANRELPESYRFTPESFVYRTLKLDFTRRFEAAQGRVRFNSASSEEDLIRHLRELSGVDHTSAMVESLRAGYAQQIEAFAAFLRSVQRPVD